MIRLCLQRYIDFAAALNHRIGAAVVYGVFLIMFILLWSVAARIFATPSLWTLEGAQFALVGYYFLGGAYVMQQDGHVRVDLLYHRWSVRRKACFDALTSFCLLFYLGVMFYGGLDSLEYALQYQERSASAWRPYLWPVKMLIIAGLGLMLIQSLAWLARDLLLLLPRPVA